MEGMWCGAFGIKPLCVGDILGRVEVMTVIPWLSAIAVGGTLQLGNPKYACMESMSSKKEQETKTKKAREGERERVSE